MNFSDSEYYLSRETATLRFQSRVLHEAIDGRNPLLERISALYYFTNNTDEFFMKRIGRLKQERQAGVTRRSVDGRTPQQHWNEAIEMFRANLEREYSVWNEEIAPALAKEGIRIARIDELDDDARAAVRSHFETEILPTLTPLAFDPGHPFPFLSNLSLSIGMWVSEDDRPDAEPVFTRIKVPDNRPAFHVLRDDPDDWLGVSLTDVIVANLDLLLPGCRIEDISLFRITRSAEVEEDDDMGDDLLDYVRNLLEERRRAPAVRLEVDASMPPKMRSLLLEQLSLREEESIEHPGLVDFLGVSMLAAIDRPDLKYPAWSPQPHPRFASLDDSEETLFSRIRSQDILLHHPYHSFAATTLRFLEQAAEDPKVLGIKIAIYRTDNDSRVLNALLEAAKNGKHVAVLVELKARFDEQHNLRWVSLLEENGIHVAYGFQDQKIHTKIALVIREEPGGVRLYSHIGTGNYHSGTAKGYTDVALLTADAEIGGDLVKVFNIFTGPHHRAEFDRLLVAPLAMKDVLLDRIERETSISASGGRGRIVAKMNALEHPEMVAALYRAGAAGVEIDLVVRDICRLRPGLPVISETICVHSVVGRFLEHSRIFYFGNGENDAPEYFIGSADWMRRNLDNRTEAVTPIRDPKHRAELRVVLETILADNRRRWTMDAGGEYTQCTPEENEPELDCQTILMERARKEIVGDHGRQKAEILARLSTGRLRV